jgi:hypothetical protein
MSDQYPSPDPHHTGNAKAAVTGVGSVAPESLEGHLRREIQGLRTRVETLDDRVRHLEHIAAPRHPELYADPEATERQLASQGGLDAPRFEPTEHRLADPARILFTEPWLACRVPPAGWRCTRQRGHDGPCAAVPDPANVIEAR